MHDRGPFLQFAVVEMEESKENVEKTKMPFATIAVILKLENNAEAY